MKSQDYLDEIRKRDGLVRAVLKKITVENGQAVFHLITDVNYTSEDVEYAGKVSARFAGMPAAARVVKSVPSEEGVRHTLLEILARRFPAFAAFVNAADIVVSAGEGGGEFSLGVNSAGLKKGREDGIVDSLEKALAKEVCGNWRGQLHEVRGEMRIESDAPEAEPVLAPRYFEIGGYSAIDDAKPKRAIYIADLNGEGTDLTVCGAITYIEERQTKNGKPYFSIAVNDASGSLRASYFSKKKTVEKVRDLRVGMSVCLTGDNEVFGGGLSFRVRAIDLGAPAADFIFVERPSRPVPAKYRVVFPVPETDYVQPDFFGTKPLCEDFMRETFVVFDLETTGLGLNAGAMDRIIEVGAVKIEAGRISERFSSFVACPTRLPAEIVKITGITDEMLVGAPDIADVIADFYKFTAGCSLVAHNAQFDSKFIRYYGEKQGYEFNGKLYDTLALSQELLHLKNYQLNTIADHFGFAFNHHRAFADAFVTAKIFIELVRIKGAL